jgi:hypothetical protein
MRTTYIDPGNHVLYHYMMALVDRLNQAVIEPQTVKTASVLGEFF